jgi:hypothetical protein
MSVGNLKTDGQKGNNFPWQLQMLKGLQGIIDALTAGVCCPPKLRAPVVIYETLPGSVPDGTYGFSITNVGLNPGFVNGQQLAIGATINFDPRLNNTVRGLSYDATGTEFVVTYML